MICRMRRTLGRWWVAYSLGFWFAGTTTASSPKVVKLAGRYCSLDYPPDGGYVYDIINVWLDDEYGLRRVQPEPKTIVDVGANIGLFALWARHLFPSARIIAYEPNPYVSPYLRRNVAHADIEVIDAGVGALGGHARIERCGESRLARTTFCQRGPVQIKGFSEVVEHAGGKIDLLKLDCEGAEWDILRAFGESTPVENIRMEYHLGPDRSLNELLELVRKSGLKLDRQISHGNYGIGWFIRGGV